MKEYNIPLWVGGLVAIIGVLLIVLGLHRQELSVLYTKAINICLECIGIG